MSEADNHPHSKWTEDSKPFVDTAKNLSEVDTANNLSEEEIDFDKMVVFEERTITWRI